MFLSSKFTKINFCSTKCRYSPNKVYPLSLEGKVRRVTVDDISLAVKEAKSIPKSDHKRAIVMWDIVYELWCHYQRQQNEELYKEIIDPIDYYCFEYENLSEGECKIYDI